MGTTPTGAPAGLQQHLVSGDWLFAALSDFGRRPCLPVDYYFLTVSAYECSCCMPAYVTEVRRHFKEAYTEAHLQTNCEAEKQKHYYDQATSTAQLVPGNIVLMKNDAYQGKQMVKDQWSETGYGVVCQVADGIPAYEVKGGGECQDHTPQPAIPSGHPERGCHTLGSMCVNFRGKCLVHLYRTYLVRGREQFTREICGWG